MNQKNSLKDLSACNGRSEFTGSAIEFIVPPKTQVVFVSDLFAADYEGGAELTSEALLNSKTAPESFFRMHSSSLTVDILEKNKDKTWIIANFTQCDISVLNYLPISGITYYVIEYDYKYCVYRSEVMHKMQTNSECDCPTRPHGNVVEVLHKNATNVFWMSRAQKEHFHSRLPGLIEEESATPHNIVLGSVFKDEDLDFLISLREERKTSKKLPIEIWAVQNSQNWIKGTKETKAWCDANGKIARLIGNMPYKEFMKTLATCHGLAFRPLDKDTCPRVVIEAKIIGIDLALNDNVQHKDEEWFKETTSEQIVEYLRTRADFFWSVVKFPTRA